MSLFLNYLPKSFFRAVASCSIFNKTASLCSLNSIPHLTKQPSYFIDQTFRTICYSSNEDRRKEFVKKYYICSENYYSKKSKKQCPLDCEKILETSQRCHRKSKPSCSFQREQFIKKEEIPISKKPIPEYQNQKCEEICTESEKEEVDQSPTMLSVKECKNKKK